MDAGTLRGHIYGVTVSIGGIFLPMFGFIGDNVGLQQVFFVATGFAVLGIILASLAWYFTREKRNATDVEADNRD